jgi:chromosome segregation ATPase
VLHTVELLEINQWLARLNAARASVDTSSLHDKLQAERRWRSVEHAQNGRLRQQLQEQEQAATKLSELLFEQRATMDIAAARLEKFKSQHHKSFSSLVALLNTHLEGDEGPSAAAIRAQATDVVRLINASFHDAESSSAEPPPANPPKESWRQSSGRTTGSEGYQFGDVSRSLFKSVWKK